MADLDTWRQVNVFLQTIYSRYCLDYELWQADDKRKKMAVAARTSAAKYHTPTHTPRAFATPLSHPFS